MKKFMIIALTAVLSVMSANAQGKCCAMGGCWSPYWYIQAQGGVNIMHPFEFDNLAPQVGLNIGRQINPLVGVRLGVEGWNKAKDNCLGDKRNFKWYNTSIDATLNLVNLFSKKTRNTVNVYALAGAGYSWSDAQNTSSTHFQPSTRVGAILEAKLCKNVSLSLEQRFTNTVRTFCGGNELADGRHMWYSSTLLGVAFNFGHKKRKPCHAVTEEPAPAPIPALVVKPEPKPEPKPVVKKEEPIKETLFYAIRESDLKDASTIDKIVAWCNEYPAKSITVSGYADKGTGNARVNKNYAELRAVKVADAIKAKGISADRITVMSFGDTVQPFANNDDNRCVIVVGE